MRRLALLSIALLALLLPSLADEKTDLRDKRYCEILIGKGGIIVPKEFDVYNTIGLNDCPARSLVEDRRREGQGRGRRAFCQAQRPAPLDDRRHHKYNPCFNRDQKLRRARDADRRHPEAAARGYAQAAQALSAAHRRAAHDLGLSRRSIGVPDSLMHEGNVYFMQSYSLEKDASQTAQTLAQLGTSAHPSLWLELPQPRPQGRLQSHCAQQHGDRHPGRSPQHLPTRSGCDGRPVLSRLESAMIAQQFLKQRRNAHGRSI